MPLAYQHVFVPAQNAHAPALVLLHGTGGDERDLLRIGQALSPGGALLGVRGDVDERGQLRFFRRLAEGVFDLADVRTRTQALANFIIEAEDEYGVGRGKFVAVGLSNGANIAATILQLVPETLRGAILFRAMVVLDEKPPPGRLVGKTIFMSSGELDPIVPREHPEQLKAMFAHAGAEVELQWQKASHGLVSADIVSARAWATKHLY